MRKPLGLILSGGQGRRMGHVLKADVMLGQLSLLDRCRDRLDPQVDGIIVNANVPLDTPHPVIPDTMHGFLGPLAGILAGLIHGAERGHTHVVSVAVDTPFFPCDLVPQLQLAGLAHGDGFAVAATGDGLQGTFAIWPVGLRTSLAAYLQSGGRKLGDFTVQHDAATALFAPTTPDAFFNVNTPQDLAEATQWI